MRVPYGWLKELLGDVPPAEELAHILTMGGLEVEEVQSWRGYGVEDTVLVTSVTANRGDLLNMIGVARHAAALMRTDFAAPRYALPETDAAVVDPKRVEVKDLIVEIDAPAACPRYSGLLIDGVRIGPSPDWMRARLEAAGVRAINNVVDCTNYVLLELGQPLHAFDFTLLAEGHVIIRMARAGEKIKTIDEQERALTADDLVIADPKGAIALAGVMGGTGSEVGEGTTRLLIESANFDATTIRKTSLRIGLSTEASYRFERGVDPNLTLPSLARAGALIVETGGGAVVAPAADVKTREFAPRVLNLRAARCNAVLGTDLSAAQMAEHLERLGMAVKADGEALEVTAPTSRPEVEREIDLIEEVAIVEGYENIPVTVHGHLADAGGLTRAQKLERRVREIMRNCGLNEAVSFSFMDPADVERMGLGEDPVAGRMVRPSNPMAADAAVMRTMMLAGLLRACATNQNQGAEDVALFEVGKVYHARGEDELPDEPKRLAGVMMGNPFTAEWGVAEVGLDFFWVKGLLEQLAGELGVDAAWRAATHPSFHPGQCARMMLSEEGLGVVGRVAPAVLAAFDLRRDVYAFEVDLDALAAAASEEKPYRPLPRFPAARRDVAVVVADDEKHAAAALEQLIRAAAGEDFEEVRLFDLFADESKLGPGRRSLAFHLSWRAADRTLTDEEVDAAMARVFAALAEVGADVRAG
jgi:phenylalanyl-tRNA synthetase beta chain